MERERNQQFFQEKKNKKPLRIQQFKDHEALTNAMRNKQREMTLVNGVPLRQTARV